MPIFEFRCQDCGKLFEKLHINPKEEIKLECPDCKSQNLQRVISKTNYTTGSGQNDTKKPSISSKSCGSGNNCSTIEFPGCD
ncbi:MAG: zinc ribbon domain-containing protein [Clostridiales bacterium]|nr:zinc ribbon domain-containing protein [Clostridiales bacterium]MCF8022512.1 zinc ribbon domain-containing protein [Clostridiales bacterium]